MSVHTFDLGGIDERLFHSEDGDKARNAFNNFIDVSAPGDVIVIDCTRVDVFDASFAGAFFAQIIASLPVSHPDRMLLVTGLNVSTRMNLNLCIEKFGFMLVEIVDGRASLLGKRAASDEQTLEVMMAQTEPVSVKEFAERAKINATAANERLSKLAKMAILHRFATPGGRTQQLYSAPAL